jgi:serine/threonine-protein kinase
LAQVEGFRDRFEAEIETLRKLNHPHIIRLFGFGEQDRQLFYAMELVAGSSLEEELGKGRRFEWREVARMMSVVCKALRHAHDRGIIHRDIKPGNLLLATDGQVKIADFGIARFFGNSKMTVAGSIIGTAEYMAPEQAAGKPVDPRADLYSLGAVAFVLLARRPLFKGKSLREVLHKQQYEIPEPLRHFNSDVPEPFEQLISQLLEKDPSRRIPNAMVLGRLFDGLQQVIETSGATVDADATDFSLVPAQDTPENCPPKDDGEKNVSKEGEQEGFAATREYTPPPVPIPPDSIQTAYVEPSSDPLAPTVAASDFPILSTESEIKEPAPKANRFIPVSEAELGREDHAEPEPTLTFLGISLNTWALIGALLIVAGGLWYFLKPPTADGLYIKIQDRIGDESSESIDTIRSAEDDIRVFLERFSDDHRAKKMREYLYEIDLNKYEKELLRSGDLQPAERAYRDALDYASSNPEKCIVKLQAVIDLYGTRSEKNLPSGFCIELARRRLAQVQKEIADAAAEQLPLLESRLDRAESLKEDEPERAKAMYRAIIELYGDHPWAASAVKRAQSALNEGGNSDKIDK